MQTYVSDTAVHGGTDPDTIHDLAGIGIGPFNLSLAALLSQVPDVNPVFFDAKPGFNWHEDLLFEDANITVSHLKDLVTLASPTNPYSFTAFLHQTKRIYRYIINGQKCVRRREFNQYLQWVAQNIDFLRFSSQVTDLDYLGDRFAVTINGNQRYFAKNIAIGCGRVPKIPQLFASHIGPDVFPATGVRAAMNDMKDKVVAIVGGGQTGAEILLQILSNGDNLPKKILWVSSRSNIAPLDDSPYANELYVPNYAQFHAGLDTQTRECLNRENLLTADGITEDLLRGIYQRLYDLEVIEGRPIVDYALGSRVTAMRKNGAQHLLEITRTATGEEHYAAVDKTVLCLGFESKIPPFIEALSPAIPLDDGKFNLNNDFSVDWEGNAQGQPHLCAQCRAPCVRSG